MDCRQCSTASASCSVQLRRCSAHRLRTSRRAGARLPSDRCGGSSSAAATRTSRGGASSGATSTRKRRLAAAASVARSVLAGGWTTKRSARMRPARSCSSATAAAAPTLSTSSPSTAISCQPTRIDSRSGESSATPLTIEGAPTALLDIWRPSTPAGASTSRISRGGPSSPTTKPTAWANSRLAGPNPTRRTRSPSEGRCGTLLPPPR
jgi:hypothetical protein